MLRRVGYSWLLVCLAVSPLSAGLVTHYTFDAVDGSIAADELGATTATLGAAASISSTSRVGGGALSVDGAIGSVAADAAVTNSDFSWSVDTRTISFWVNGPGVDGTGAIQYADDNQAFVSMGQNNTGQRFSTKTHGGSPNIRVEIQGTGSDWGSVVADSNWHHVAVVVPTDNAIYSDIQIFLDGNQLTNPSTNSTPINTADGPITFGSECCVFTERVATGLIDDVAIWDEAFDANDIQTLLAVYNDNTVMSGNASDFNAARAAFAGGPGTTAAYGNRVWSYATGLSGPTISGSGNNVSVIFDATAGTGATSMTFIEGDVNLD
ncbi:MAG: LamG domain-containing protein, partial [Planctomycetales bacterium]|nr:LamG domain-containing protein [Planctomycetales bacterium]